GLKPKPKFDPNQAIRGRKTHSAGQIHKCDRSGRCVMNQAAKEEDPFWLRTALAHGGDPNAINHGNRHYPNSTPIYYAIQNIPKSHAENARILVEAGADINHQDGYGHTPLRDAAGAGMYETVVLLLEAGADPCLADKHGYSLINWFKGRDERLVPDEDQIPWFRKAREILVKRGLIELEPKS
ncbi:MAG: ankyrin repeat domain-containing protein, partial [Planctomycetales bacterium]|nr:ankyrin repeat domain-containing protein [Planctomycetales bacterium]